MMHLKVWGPEGIDDNTIEQMKAALSIPVAVDGALMADAHLGYGLPIGGVLALDNAVCPYAVGVDIACRMKLTVFDLHVSNLELYRDEFAKILERETFFGVGVSNANSVDHPVMHKDWGVTEITRTMKDTAQVQLGTSGSGNHFVEWGRFQMEEGSQAKIALMSHSGSRGPGAQVCNWYTRRAKDATPEYGELAWLSLDSADGQEYWAAMNLMGEYASANHDLIHNSIAKAIGATPEFVVENHHNFAWKEIHGGKEVIVHRKGATPAGVGVMGVIPGSMGTPAYVVVGQGVESSLCSASHGAGRVMSRKQAKKTFNYDEEIARLASQGVTVLSAGVDEVCGVYKNIDTVMLAQHDLVRKVARFDPKIVKMA